MSAGDLPVSVLVETAPGTAIVCAFVLGLLVAAAAVGMSAWVLFAWRSERAHDEQCASCADVEAVPMSDEVLLDVADTAGVVRRG